MQQVITEQEHKSRRQHNADGRQHRSARQDGFDGFPFGFQPARKQDECQSDRADIVGRFGGIEVKSGTVRPRQHADGKENQQRRNTQIAGNFIGKNAHQQQRAADSQKYVQFHGFLLSLCRV